MATPHLSSWLWILKDNMNPFVTTKLCRFDKDKHHLFDDDHLNDEEILQLEDFLLAIRGSEIESVALFKLEVPSDFEYYVKSSQNQTIENTH